jgi:hypothetical protein
MLRESSIFQHDLNTQKEQIEAKDKEIQEVLLQNELCKELIKIFEMICNFQAGPEAEGREKETQEQGDITEVDQLNSKIKAVEKFMAAYSKRPEGGSIMQTSQSSILIANADIQARSLLLTEGQTIIQNLQCSFDAVNDDLKAKQKEVDESKAEIERLQMMDEDANGMIDSLRIQIQELTEEWDTLVHMFDEDSNRTIHSLHIQIRELTEERNSLSQDLQQAEDDLNTQTRLASRTLERRNRQGGVKRGRDELWKDGESDRVSKRGRSNSDYDQSGRD